MSITATTHLADTTLADFVLGKLADTDVAEAERHLADCPHCQARAAAACPDDRLLTLLVAAAAQAVAERADTLTLPPGGTPADFAPGRPWGGDGLSGPAYVAADDRLPDGLLRHPRYRPVRRLGGGGMGVVWLAEHTVMERPVALKFIRPVFLARPGAVELFRREVRAAARLNHPNIATAYDADEADGAHFLVMEYVPGETLLDVVKRGPLPAAEACRAARDTARGLAHAHAAGLVHRDVKPGNLIRAADGTVKLLDFGLVGVGAGPAGLTHDNLVVGTPDYIAPEQASDAQASDGRADVYALGCTLYHLLAGRVPYPAGSAQHKIDAHRHAAASAEPLAGVPAPLVAVLAKMMAKNPADRYPTATSVADALEPFCTAVSCPPPRRPRGRRPAVAAAGLAAVLLAAGVVYTIRRGSETVTIKTDDPDIDVVLRRSGELVRIVDTKTNTTWELDTTTMRLAVGGERTIDLPDREPLVLRRNGDTTVTIRHTPPVVVSTGTGRHPLLAVHDFREAHGVDLAGLRAWLGGLPAGFRPADISARAGAVPPRFDAVAVADGRTLPVEAHLELVNADRPGPRHLTDFQTMSQAGWSLRISCPYDTGTDRPRHHVWVRDGGGWFANAFGLAGVPAQAARWQRDAVRPAKVYLNATDRGRGDPARPLAALLTDDEGLPWEFTPEVAPDDLPAKLAEVRRRGWRPDVLGDVGAGADRTFALSAVPNPDGLRWEFQAGLTAAGYEAAVAERSARRLRPQAIASEGNGGAVRYAVLWVEYSPR